MNPNTISSFLVILIIINSSQESNIIDLYLHQRFYPVLYYLIIEHDEGIKKEHAKYQPHNPAPRSPAVRPKKKFQDEEISVGVMATLLKSCKKSSVI